MNSLLQLQIRVLEESGAQCGIDTMLDRKTFEHRVNTEGESFQTITLPSWVKDLYKALDQGMVTPNLFSSFKRLKGQKLPVFLGGFMSIVFDPVTGELTQHEDDAKVASSIRAMVQFTGFAGKLFELCNPKRTADALQRYVENDARVASLDNSRHLRLESIGLTDDSIRVAMHVLFGNVNAMADKAISREQLRPKHGPGATADKLFGNEKWQQQAWPQELEDHFPFGKWAYNSWLNYLEAVDAGQVADPGTVMPVKVITVPKTQKTPRIIAVEPTAYQYMQQAIRAVLEKSIQADYFAESMMGYSSQVPNQILARKGSIDGSLATLDLSDASDLVSFSLVMRAFHDWPALQAALRATRSTHARVSGYEELIPLAKFASMGSALCFPIEAMMFSCITLLACRSVLNPTGTLFETKRLLEGKVRVYGDDIIVPADCAQSVVDYLEAYGLSVNHNKSFWTGRFRESCGKEYWNGFDVSYVKIRYRLFDLRRALSQDVPETVHSVALRNNLYFQGYYETVDWMDSQLSRRLNGVYPIVQKDSPALGRHNAFDFQIDRIDRNLQKPLVKAYVVSTESPSSPLDGYAALMKCLVNDSDLPNPDPEHLLRAGRPSSLRIKKRWTSPV